MVDDVKGVAQAVREIRLRLVAFRTRLIGELVPIAEAVEQALGFDAAPEADDGDAEPVEPDSLAPA